MQYQKTERELLPDQRHLWPRNQIRLFDLGGIGIDSTAFVSRFRPLFNRLPWDPYDKRRRQLDLLRLALPQNKTQLEKHYKNYYLGSETEADLEPLVRLLSEDERATYDSFLPDRRRQIAFYRFSLKINGTWEFQRLQKAEYSQQVETNDYRSLPRTYDPLPIADGNDPLLVAFLERVADMTKEARPDVLEMELIIYLNATVAYPGVPGDNSPEGVHQDGADYIVSALVVSRENIRGGESNIYLGEASKNSVLRKTLGVGEGIFQADGGSDIWHDVSKIVVKDETQNGVRCTIGVDVMIKRTISDEIKQSSVS